MIMVEGSAEDLNIAKQADILARRIRVIVISDAVANRNGVGAYYADLVGHLKDYMAHAELVSPGGETGDYAHSLSFPLPGDPTQQVYLPRAVWIWKRIKTIAPDVLVIPTPGPYGLLAFCAARCLRIPLCVGYHTRYEKLTEMYWPVALNNVSRFCIKGLNRVLFTASERVVGNSAEMVEEAMENGATMAQMIGTPIAPSFLYPPFPLTGGRLSSVCYAGRLAPEKNIEDILKAAARLPHIRFIVAGDGPLRDMVLTHATAASNIEYVGWVSREGVKAVIDRADMLMLPSKVESFGTIALEAMARRRLVLVSENCGILNWPDLAHGVYGIKPHEAMADAIFRISEIGFSERLEKAKTAHDAAKRFNQRTIGQWVSLFADIAAGNPHPAGT